MKIKQLILMVCLFVFFSGKADNISKILSKTNYAEKYKDYHQILVFDSTNVDVKESGLSYVTMKKLFLVVDNHGSSNLQSITFDYDPLSAFVQVKQMKIYRKNGTIENIPLSKVYDYPAPAHMIYWGARQKMIDVGLLNPGDALYVEVFRKGFTYALLRSDDDKYIPPMKGQFYDIVRFHSSYPIAHKVYEVVFPLDKKVKYKLFNADFVVKNEKKAKHLFSFKLDNIIPVKREPNMVGLDNVIPKLLITTTQKWQEKSIWFYKVNEDYGSFDSTPKIKKKVDEILVGAKSELDSIAKLTHWVADEIRYSGISMGKGEGYTLHKGEVTFRDRCGVCKDKAGMLITMLRAAGFKSYPAMTMAGSRIEDIPADQFNHSVTVVQLHNGKYKVLDPTWVPFVRELWSSLEQQQNYLPGLPNGSDLCITPISKPENHFLNVENNATVNKNGSISGEVVITAEGQSDASVRGMFTRWYRSTWDANVEEKFLSVFPGAKIINVTHTDPYDYQNHNVKIVYKYVIPDFVTIFQNKFIIKSFFSSEFFTINQFYNYMSMVMSRKFDYRMWCTQKVHFKEIYSFPKQISQVGNGYSVKESNSCGELTSDVKILKNKLEFDYVSSFNKRVYKADSWSNMKNILSKIKSIQGNCIVGNLSEN